MRSFYDARVTKSAGGTAPAPSFTVRPSAARAIFIVAVFFVVLGATCALLDRNLPFPPVPLVWAKLEQLARYGNEYDVLFLGSSRVNFQIMPAVFDRIAREQGLPVRSFNAGIAAMRPPEDDYYLEQILRTPHRRLRWVFLEMMPLRAEPDRMLAGTRRFTYWRDVERTKLMMRCSLQECAEACRDRDPHRGWWPEKIQECARSVEVLLNNLGLFGESLSNFGRGEELLMRRFGQTKPWKEDALEQGTKWDGWAVPIILKSIAGNEEHLATYQRAYAEFLKATPRFDPGDDLSFEALRVKIARLTAAGITPILIIPPAVSYKPYLPAQLAGQSFHILDFSDPREYPELFTIEHRLDGSHLNAAGAEIFTDALTRKFLGVVGNSGKIH